MKSNELKAIITRAKKVINSKINVEECRNVEISGGFVTVSDLETTYSQKVEISETIDVCINFEELDKLSRKLKNNEPIDFKQNDNELIISYKSSEFKYTDEKTGKISEIVKPQVSNYVGSELLTPEAVKSLKIATQYVSKDGLRPAIQNVLIDKQNYIVSTDCHIMYYNEIEHNIEQDILISTKLIKALSDTYYLVEYVIYDNKVKWLRLSNENEIFVHKCESSNYPNWRGIIPEQHLATTTVNNKELIEIIELASITANKATDLIKLKFSDCTEISSKDIDFNKESTHIIEAKHKGATIEIGMNASNFLKILKNITTDNIDISTTACDRAMIINDNYLIMPINLKNE